MQAFLLCLKSNDTQTFKQLQLQKKFSPVCMLLLQLALMNVFFPFDI